MDFLIFFHSKANLGPANFESRLDSRLVARRWLPTRMDGLTASLPASGFNSALRWWRCSHPHVLWRSHSDITVSRSACEDKRGYGFMASSIVRRMDTLLTVPMRSAVELHLYAQCWTQAHPFRDSLHSEAAIQIYR